MAQSVYNSKQCERNAALLAKCRYMKPEVISQALPLRFDIASQTSLTKAQVVTLQALQIEAARTAIKSLASLAKIGELDHLGGALDLIPALMMTLGMVDYEGVEFTIENAHTSIGYFSALCALGFLDEDKVVDEFRRGLDIPGHVSWLPGGTQLNGGRLGVMIACAVGQSLGKKAIYGDKSWVICHCGDAGWISGQALDGFNGADLHKAPITFVMHRNGVQLSGSTKQIMNKDPRPIIKSLGIEIIQTPSIHDEKGLYKAYRKAWELARQGRPSLIYPTGNEKKPITLAEFARQYGIEKETAEFAASKGVAMDKEVWIPGALMSYRDIVPMLECIFLVNGLPGGAGHHDGHMKGRDAEKVLANPMLTMSKQQQKALAKLRKQPKRVVVTTARPAPGSPNLEIADAVAAEVKLPAAGEKQSPRAGVEAGYALVAKTFPEQVFIVGCDLDPSTKLGKASKSLPAGHVFEMSIEEQVATLMADGLACASRKPALNVVSTFAAFFEGIAREGMEMWRYQRNLTGANEGLNVTMHLSHVGSCTGRDHFSGWSLDWINLAIGYLPYLHRFYAPADARSAFIAVRDLAAHYGGHIIGIPRDNLPVLAKQDGSGALYNPADKWEAATHFRSYQGARRVILAFGAPAFLAEKAAAELAAQGKPTDVYVINGLPLADTCLPHLFSKYPEGIVTIEDGLIGCRHSGLRGFAALVATADGARAVPMAHLGITNPRIAPADGHIEVWEHFGLTSAALVEAVAAL
ncbi:MAG: hypothetical protein NTX50_10280 [Candidatus Sumerlaeota bacterium]|nr:hypothetical protein [Candidatus Sumerlaeota bacterium]